MSEAKERDTDENPAQQEKEVSSNLLSPNSNGHLILRNFTAEKDLQSFGDRHPPSQDRGVIDDNSMRNFQCTMCKFTTRYKTNLTTHMRRHLGDAGRIYKCPHCPYSTASNSDLNRHKKIRHLSQEDMANALKCGLCSFSSMFQSNMRKHFLKKHARKPTTRIAKQSYGPVMPVATRYIDLNIMNKTSPANSTVNNMFALNSFRSHGAILPQSHAIVKKEPQDMFRQSDNCIQVLDETSECLSEKNAMETNSRASSELSPRDNARITPDVLRGSNFGPVFPGPEMNFSRPYIHNQDPHSDATPGGSGIPTSAYSSDSGLPSAPSPDEFRDQRTSLTSTTSPMNSLLGNLRDKYKKNTIRSPRNASYSEGNSTSESEKSSSSLHRSGKLYACDHCSIYFGECAMYLMHRSLHNLENPLMCNLCGHNATDKYDFVAHYVNHR